MSDEQEVCSICGGVLFVDYTFTFRQSRIFKLNVSARDKMCFGHPQPEQRHDGYLDDTGGHHVSLWCRVDDPHSHFVTLRYLQTDAVSHIHMDPKQALSLLSWLQQEERCLREIVKEEEQANHD